MRYLSKKFNLKDYALLNLKDYAYIWKEKNNSEIIFFLNFFKSIED